MPDDSCLSLHRCGLKDLCHQRSDVLLFPDCPGCQGFRLLSAEYRAKRHPHLATRGLFLVRDSRRGRAPRAAACAASLTGWYLDVVALAPPPPSALGARADVDATLRLAVQAALVVASILSKGGESSRPTVLERLELADVDRGGV